MIPMPKASAMGVLDYAGLALGLVLGFALFQGPADQISKAISKGN